MTDQLVLVATGDLVEVIVSSNGKARIIAGINQVLCEDGRFNSICSSNITEFDTVEEARAHLAWLVLQSNG